MLRHESNQLVVGLLAGESELPIGLVTRSQDIARADAEHLQDTPDLGFTQRLVAIIAIAVFNASLVEQGDRPAACASGAGADQFQHGMILIPRSS